MTETTPPNPLLCDTDKGLCEIPANKNEAEYGKTAPLQILYFTDPICSSCWGIEPQLRRLKLEYGDQLHITYHMGGLLPSWEVYNSGGISKPSDVAHHWDEVSGHYEMPIDGDVWLEDPLPSSYPPSIAFKAAQMQDEQLAVKFLRRIREMVFLEKKNITKWEHLEKAAQETGLNAEKLKSDFEGPANAAFQKDLALARSLGVRGFPTLFFTDANQNRLTLYGARPYEQFEQMAKTIYPDLVKSTYDPNPESLFKHYPTLTAKEFAVLSGISYNEAIKKLTALSDEKKRTKYSTKNGSIWR
jgi:predicted DsbA family dithiol-disulfide isomerase